MYRLAGVAALILAVTISIAGVARADTSASPDTNTRANFSPATVDATTGLLPGATLAGASGGDVVKIHIDGQAGKFHGVIQTRLCRAYPGFSPSIDAELSPSNGDCLPPSPPGFTGASATSGAATADSSQSFSDYTFAVGQGTETVHNGAGTFISCDVSSPCALWIQESVDTSLNADGYVLKHYIVSYAGTPSSPTVVSTPGNAKLTIDLTPPTNTGNASITSYSVTVTGPGGGTQSGAGTHYVFTGLTNGTRYSVTSTATNTAANGTTHTSAPSAPVANASTTPVPPPATNVTQTISADRPAGALVLTQVCGAKGATTTGTAPTVGSAPGGAADPMFSGYPYPTDANGLATPTYPTNCAVQLSTAHLITSGAGAGHFFEATGDLSQIAVVDTRDTDNGWTSTATMGPLTNGSAPNDVLSGNELGWTPVKASDSGTYVSSDGTSYTQQVTAGGPVAPNQPDATGPLGSGAAVLGSAPGSHGLGIARLDAALRLWIPIYAHNGHYTGTLTITAV